MNFPSNFFASFVGSLPFHLGSISRCVPFCDRFELLSAPVVRQPRAAWCQSEKFRSMNRPMLRSFLTLLTKWQFTFLFSLLSFIAELLLDWRKVGQSIARDCLSFWAITCAAYPNSKSSLCRRFSRQLIQRFQHQHRLQLPLLIHGPVFVSTRKRNLKNWICIFRNGKWQTQRNALWCYEL